MLTNDLLLLMGRALGKFARGHRRSLVCTQGRRQTGPCHQGWSAALAHPAEVRRALLHSCLVCAGPEVISDMHDDSRQSSGATDKDRGWDFKEQSRHPRFGILGTAELMQQKIPHFLLRMNVSPLKLAVQANEALPAILWEEHSSLL